MRYHRAIVGSYVTTTAPLALTHARSTWSAVALSLVAMLLSGASRVPPGLEVMGLCLNSIVVKHYNKK